MAHIFANGVLETANAPGTGAVTLTGAVAGYVRFSARCATGDTVHYRIEAVNGLGIPTGLWELGRGTYSAANTLTRTTVLESSNANTLENFVGAVRVSITALAPNSSGQVTTDWLNALGNILPAGIIAYCPTSTPPASWIKANGAAISRTAYAALFAAIGTSFGAGDGSTTFNVPDLRGEFIRGWDDGRTLDSGRTIGTVQASANLSHNHGAGDSGHGHSAWTDTQGWHAHGVAHHRSEHEAGGYGLTLSGAFGNRPMVSGGGYGYTTDGDGSHGHNVGIGTGYANITIGYSGGSEARPRNVAMLAIIKY